MYLPWKLCADSGCISCAQSFGQIFYLIAAAVVMCYSLSIGIFMEVIPRRN